MGRDLLGVVSLVETVFFFAPDLVDQGVFNHKAHFLIEPGRIFASFGCALPRVRIVAHRDDVGRGLRKRVPLTAFMVLV